MDIFFRAVTINGPMLIYNLNLLVDSKGNERLSSKKIAARPVSQRLFFRFLRFFDYGTDVRASDQRPRVKSGNLIGAEPLATEISLKGPGALHAAAS